MKDKKFLVLCMLGLVWLAMFVAMLFGAKIHPRVEVMVYVICLLWFAYWTLSIIFGKLQPTDTNANTKEAKNTKSKKN